MSAPKSIGHGNFSFVLNLVGPFEASPIRLAVGTSWASCWLTFMLRGKSLGNRVSGDGPLCSNRPVGGRISAEKRSALPGRVRGLLPNGGRAGHRAGNAAGRPQDPAQRRGAGLAGASGGRRSAASSALPPSRTAAGPRPFRFAGASNRKTPAAPPPRPPWPPKRPASPTTVPCFMPSTRPWAPA